MRPLSWLGPLALTITGGVVYHVSAKSLPKDLNPALVLVGAYATALCGSLAAYVVLPADQAATAASRVLSPAVISVGLGATMIELGYVLTYRAAWPVSVAAILINSMASPCASRAHGSFGGSYAPWVRDVVALSFTLRR